MSQTRFTALDIISARTSLDVEYSDLPDQPISEFYGENVFGKEAMLSYLTDSTFHKIQQAIQSGSKLSREVAKEVAKGMKQWAMDKGATHYAHWFQPLTGRTAEKHDSFFTLNSDGDPIEAFSGTELAQQEPDGSSFPGGGLRSTFEARGYTAWDPSSPAFIFDSPHGKTLCIPTIFVTYSGEAMDFKLPLLKSQSYLEQQAINVCQYFDTEIDRVIATLGWEQEYFLIDEALFRARPDLLMTGRTLVGKTSPKGQQLDDHYFGSIPDRVYSFMRDLETECHKLGIPVRTRHNEVGPGQYELAPMFEEVNVAVDHNQLLMDVMDRVAARHKLRVLLHEKPFEGVNGSGKHNNWSMSTNTGKNLLSPGKKPGKNLRFLTFFVNVIRAVHEYADLLRASVASASNDHRLGANEAPPAIISVFIGSELTKILTSIASKETYEDRDVQDVLDLLSKIPNLEKDNTDRNRTSPFAFTGNKFEIRMVGSTMNCAAPMTIMNTIVGHQLAQFHNEVTSITDDGKSLQSAILSVLRKYIKEAKDVLFEGDGYSEEWEKEAVKRGLPNLPNTPDAIKAYISDKAIELFTSTAVLSEKELKAHYGVMVDNYILKRQIESRTLGELAYNQILPAAIRYQSEVASNIEGLKKAGLPEHSYEVQMDIIHRISANLRQIKNGVAEMTNIRRRAHQLSEEDCARVYATEIVDFMNRIRLATDRLEYLVDDQFWPLPKYRELLFLR